MKTFEERYTAWIDGKLFGIELQDFEREIEAHPEADFDKESALKLGSLLRTHGCAPQLTNPDFFNHQLLTRIASKEGQLSTSETRTRPRWFLQPFAWLAASAFIAFVLYKAAMPQPGPDLAKLVNTPVTPQEAPYSAEIVSAESTDPDISVTPIHSEEDKVTVLWVDGLNYLPASYHVE